MRRGRSLTGVHAAANATCERPPRPSPPHRQATGARPAWQSGEGGSLWCPLRESNVLPNNCCYRYLHRNKSRILPPNLPRHIVRVRGTNGEPERCQTNGDSLAAASSSATDSCPERGGSVRVSGRPQAVTGRRQRCGKSPGAACPCALSPPGRGNVPVPRAGRVCPMNTRSGCAGLKPRRFSSEG